MSTVSPLAVTKKDVANTMGLSVTELDKRFKLVADGKCWFISGPRVRRVGRKNSRTLYNLKLTEVVELTLCSELIFQSVDAETRLFELLSEYFASLEVRAFFRFMKDANMMSPVVREYMTNVHACQHTACFSMHVIQPQLDFVIHSIKDMTDGANKQELIAECESAAFQSSLNALIVLSQGAGVSDPLAYSSILMNVVPMEAVDRYKVTMKAKLLAFLQLIDRRPFDKFVTSLDRLNEACFECGLRSKIQTVEHVLTVMVIFGFAPNALAAAKHALELFTHRVLMKVIVETSQLGREARLLCDAVVQINAFRAARQQCNPAEAAESALVDVGMNILPRLSAMSLIKSKLVPCIAVEPQPAEEGPPRKAARLE